MRRTDLLDSARTAELALGRLATAPALMNLCFTDGHVVAFDDVLAVRSPCALGLDGCVPGRQLIDFLNSCAASEVDVRDQSGSEVVLKVGRSRLTLPLTPRSEYPLEEPVAGRGLPTSPDFVDALLKAQVSIGQDSLQAWCYGVTLQLGTKASRLLSTNNFAITSVDVKMVGAKQNVVLPPRLVDSVLKLARRESVTSLLLWEDNTWVGAEFSGGTTMFCRTVPGADPTKFKELLDGIRADSSNSYPVPKALGGSLTRSLVFMTSPMMSERTARVRVAGEKLYIEVESDRGSMRDVHGFPGCLDDVDMRTPSELLLKALPYSRDIAFVVGRAVRMLGEGFEYTVSAAQ